MDQSRDVSVHSCVRVGSEWMFGAIRFCARTVLIPMHVSINPSTGVLLLIVLDHDPSEHCNFSPLICVLPSDGYF